MSELVDSVFSSFLSYWWLALPLMALVFLRDWWRITIVDKYIDKLDWVLLELKIPKENLKSIKAMEQVIAAFHGTYTFGLRPSEIWVDGRVEEWMSLEMVGFHDGVHFYVRCLKMHRNLVEAAVFSQFPGAEVVEAEDYTNRLKNKPFEHRDIFGTDYVLDQEEFYPIRTYINFEDNNEENRIDPIATITEVMSRLKKNEAIWIQILIQPTGTEWFPAAQAKIKELMGETKDKPKSVIAEVAKDVGDVIKNIPSAAIAPPEFGEAGKDDKARVSFKFRSPSEEENMKAITMKMSKPAFNTVFRFIYIDDKDEFTMDNVFSVWGALRQFSDPSLNAIRPNLKTFTKKSRVGYINREKRLADRKKNMMINYIKREFPRPVNFPFTKQLPIKSFVMNTEEIASLFHMPTDFVKSKKIQSIDSRKGQAPIDLPKKDQ